MQLQDCSQDSLRGASLNKDPAWWGGINIIVINVRLMFSTGNRGRTCTFCVSLEGVLLEILLKLSGGGRAFPRPCRTSCPGKEGKGGGKMYSREGKSSCQGNSSSGVQGPEEKRCRISSDLSENSTKDVLFTF